MTAPVPSHFRNASFGRLVEAGLKRTAAALRDADVPFCLVGSLAAWVRGGPESSHDLDFGIRERDLLRAVDALERIGMTIEIPPENWLVKAWIRDGEDERETVLVDLIYSASGLEIDDDVLARADVLQVLAQGMPVLGASDLMVTKLLALREQHLDYTAIVSTARAIREQVAWDDVRERTVHSPYAAAFFAMAERLALVPGADGEAPAGPVDALAPLRDDAPGARDYPQRRRLLEQVRNRTRPGARVA